MKKLIIALMLCGCPAGETIDGGAGGMGGSGGGGQGGEDNQCRLPFAIVDQECQIISCYDNHADCDGELRTGCEVELGTSEHCADCEHSCQNGSMCDSEQNCNCVAFPVQWFNNQECGQCLAAHCCAEITECMEHDKCSKKLISWNACTEIEEDDECCMPETLRDCSKENACSC